MYCKITAASFVLSSEELARFAEDIGQLNHTTSDYRFTHSSLISGGYLWPDENYAYHSRLSAQVDNRFDNGIFSP